jgi:hypothetical protein
MLRVGRAGQEVGETTTVRMIVPINRANLRSHAAAIDAP